MPRACTTGSLPLTASRSLPPSTAWGSRPSSKGSSTGHSTSGPVKFILKTLDFSEEHIKKHKGVFISTAGQNMAHVFDSAFPAITAFFHGTGFDYSENIVANNMDQFNGIKNHPTALKEAYEKGRQVVKDLEKLKST